jgi:hypothetical protein
MGMNGKKRLLVIDRVTLENPPGCASGRRHEVQQAADAQTRLQAV